MLYAIFFFFYTVSNGSVTTYNSGWVPSAPYASVAACQSAGQALQSTLSVGNLPAYNLQFAANCIPVATGTTQPSAAMTQGPQPRD